ncbi:MAG: response regulator [Deltaproteobacteria bacterium]|nr:response regulator [Deltaproteobacteria bacterium]
MSTLKHILIADRNPHVRRFLKRELEAEGYRVRLAESGVELLKWAFDPHPLDLVILDPDLPDTVARQLMDKLRNRKPPLPVVIHAFLSDYAAAPDMLDADAFVEKGGNSIESLKKAIRNLKTRSPS